MKKTVIYLVLIVLISSIATGCASSGKAKGCGCNLHKGFVGY
ncbi:MAG TPA: hypothetical protein PLQ32_03275 [Flavihumibacter sp.]|nr:hypothetical protein [Flavihumibacter sp.]HPZ87099.1 hypothetical protein [Flavihumibacter sp.]HQD08218.1 hypothetical protein [Flavihumibacter sp.]